MSRHVWDWWRFALSLAGLAIAGYLTALHYNSAIPLACKSGGIVNCESVLTSPVSVVFGAPVALYGLLWFAVAIVLAVCSLRTKQEWESPLLRWAGLIWALLGTVTVLYLVYLEVGVVGKLCLWCTVVHLLVLALLAIQVLSDPLRADA